MFSARRVVIALLLTVVPVVAVAAVLSARPAGAQEDTPPATTEPVDPPSTVPEAPADPSPAGASMSDDEYRQVVLAGLVLVSFSAGVVTLRVLLPG